MKNQNQSRNKRIKMMMVRKIERNKVIIIIKIGYVNN
jgi:hypothetical protein